MTSFASRSAARPVLCAAVIALATLASVEAPSVSAAAEFPRGYERYHTYGEMIARLRSVARAHPGIVRLIDAGRSYRGRVVWLVKISDHVARDEREPEVFFNALTHAREHLTLEQALALIRWLTDGYATDERITDIVDGTEIWIMPAVNPDGASFDISRGRFHSWRKNRQPNQGSRAIGTDINRNFGYRWGCCGTSSPNPAAITYRGPRAFSAPETRVVRDFVRSRVVGGVQQIRSQISFHSFGEQILFPYGYTKKKVPPDMDRHDRRVMVALARKMAARNGYRALHEARLYITSGTFLDWAYGAHRILSFTFELAPRTPSAGGFYLPQRRIRAETERNRTALLWFIERAGCPSAVIGDACRSGVSVATGARSAV